MRNERIESRDEKQKYFLYTETAEKLRVSVRSGLSNIRRFTHSVSLGVSNSRLVYKEKLLAPVRLIALRSKAHVPCG